MSTQPLMEFAPTEPSRYARRTVLGLGVGAALGGIGLSPGLALAQPKRQRQAGGTSSAGARRKPGRKRERAARRRPQRRPRYKVVTRTFTSTAPITIPGSGAATPYPSLLQVGGLRLGRIQDVNATVRGLTHEVVSDLDIILVAPNGRSAVGLLSTVGAGAENVTLVFDDQAASFLPQANLVSGIYKPTMPGVAPSPETATLRAFTGLNPNGAWRLYVADHFSGLGGSIAGWALTIKARVRV